MSIPIGKKGFITNPGEVAPYILLEDDRANTGGYFVWTTDTPDFSGKICYDTWYLPEDIEYVLAESNREIIWDYGRLDDMNQTPESSVKPLSTAESSEELARIRSQFEDRTFSDSVELLREDRER
ncbi:MAG: hypothetical protein JWQ02_1801 [Capsulimonas sp.]|nr:hypothetical protein [Capsulimonas sp.]